MAHRVLVVDDEVQVAKSIQLLLRGARFEVAIACDGPSALAILDEFAPDLVISDFRMPVMNGAELVRAIRQRRPATLCLLLSGYVGIESVDCECLAKPFETRALLATIKQRLGVAS
jgi:adenylate cyclase